MKYFCIPADFKKENIDRYSELNEMYEDSKLIETYGQVTVGNVLNSGRIVGALPEVDFKKLESFVKYSLDRGIIFDYTLNPACMGNFEFTSKGAKEIFVLLRDLYNIGVKSITVSTPSLIELVKASGFEFRLKASAICEIQSPDKAAFYKSAGADRIVLDPDITRKFNIIKEICGYFGEGVELIVNNVCYKNCAYKMFHYNHEAHATLNTGTREVHDYYINRCAMQKASDLKNVIRLSWIRPEDLQYYMKSGICYFKIQGRQNVLQGEPVKVLEHYMKESFDGNLYDLITLFAPYTSFQPYIDNKKLESFVKKFFDDPGFCKNCCWTCKYCESWAKKSMDEEKAQKINRKALDFFDEYDSYKQIINSLKDSEEKNHELLEAKEKIGFSEFNF